MTSLGWSGRACGCSRPCGSSSSPGGPRPPYACLPRGTNRRPTARIHARRFPRLRTHSPARTAHTTTQHARKPLTCTNGAYDHGTYTQATHLHERRIRPRNIHASPDTLRFLPSAWTCPSCRPATEIQPWERPNGEALGRRSVLLDPRGRRGSACPVPAARVPGGRIWALRRAVAAPDVPRTAAPGRPAAARSDTRSPTLMAAAARRHPRSDDGREVSVFRRTL